MPVTDGGRAHLLRRSLPWRKDERLTMCGSRADKVRVVTPSKFLAISPTFTCDACLGYAGADHHWADPIQNELLQPSSEPKRIHNELEAIKELIARHPEEFESLLAAVTAEAALQKPRLGDRSVVFVSEWKAL